MSEPLWKVALRRGVEALDWEKVEALGERWVGCRVSRSLADPMVVTAAHAALEIDKLVRFYAPSDGPELAAAAASRARLSDLILNEGLEYDAILKAKAAYRSELVEAVWALMEQDPARKLAQWVEPHEG